MQKKRAVTRKGGELHRSCQDYECDCCPLQDTARCKSPSQYHLSGAEESGKALLALKQVSHCWAVLLLSAQKQSLRKLPRTTIKHALPVQKYVFYMKKRFWLIHDAKDRLYVSPMNTRGRDRTSERLNNLVAAGNKRCHSNALPQTSSEEVRN